MSRAFKRGAIRAQMPRTIWASGCSSWYIDERGRVASWPWTFDRFVEDLRAPRWDGLSSCKVWMRRFAP